MSIFVGVEVMLTVYVDYKYSEPDTLESVCYEGNDVPTWGD